MKSKKINKLIGTLVLTSVFSGVVVPNISISNAYAFTQGVDYTKEYRLPNESEEWYNANAIKITPETHPQYFTVNPWDSNRKFVVYSKIPFDDKIYYWEDIDSLGDKTTEYFKISKYDVREIGNSTPGEILVYIHTALKVESALSPEYGVPFMINSVVGYVLGEDLELRNHLLELKHPGQDSGSGTSSQDSGTGNSSQDSGSGTSTSQKLNTRLGGKTRVDTSLSIADSYRNGHKLDSVILASAGNFPDALAGGILTKKYPAPILLTNKSSNLSKTTLDYIKANVNKSAKIIILGSTGVIDDSVVNNLKSVGFNNIKRLGGANRFETNMAIINEYNPSVGSDVIVSYGMNFPDALSISPVSAVNGMPIILVNGSLSSDAKALLNRIRPNNIYITGSTGVVPSSVENELKKYSSNVKRLGGINRYETSRIINEEFKNVLTGENALLASGSNFPDALSGTSLARKLNAPIVLVNPVDTTKQKEFISKNNKTKVFVLGGTGAVSEDMLNQITK